MILMFIYSFAKIICDTYIQNGVVTICQNNDN